MDLINRITGRQPTALPARPPRAAEHAATEPLLGCGWFESSHELQRGLAVCEHDESAAVVNGLPLDVWLHWHLAGAALSSSAQGCA